MYFLLLMYNLFPVLHLYRFIISQLWLTSHPISTVVLSHTGTPGTSRKICSEDADGETRTRNPSVINLEPNRNFSLIYLIRYHCKFSKTNNKKQLKQLKQLKVSVPAMFKI